VVGGLAEKFGSKVAGIFVKVHDAPTESLSIFWQPRSSFVDSFARHTVNHHNVNPTVEALCCDS